MKKTVSALLIAAVLLLCLLPSAGMLFTGPSEGAANEILTPFPALRTRDGSVNTDFPVQLIGYLDDHFALRQEFITLWARLNAGLLRTSADEDVVLGTDGFLFYRSTLADYTGGSSMTDRELWCAARTLRLLQDCAEAQSADFLFAVAPDKLSLYGEYLPSAAPQEGAGNAQRLFALLSRMDVNYADLFAAFEAEDELLYYRTDTHWNTRGAALAADTLLNSLDRESSFFAGPFSPDGQHRGDLYEMLYPAGRELERDFVYLPGHSYAVTSRSDDPDSIRLTTESGGAGSLLCYRDSFGRALFPYLADSFARCTFSRENDYAPAGLAVGDTMVVELVERNLHFLNENIPTMPAPAAETVSADTTAGEAAVREERCSLTGFRRYRGIFSGIVPTDEACVYIVTENGAFEAFPTPDGFVLTLPEEIDLFSGECFAVVDGTAVTILEQK